MVGVRVAKRRTQHLVRFLSLHHPVDNLDGLLRDVDVRVL
jgi:hypothetical protein